MGDLTFTTSAQIIEVGGDPCEVVMAVDGRSRLTIIVSPEIARQCAGKLYDFVELDVRIRDKPPAQAEPKKGVCQFCGRSVGAMHDMCGPCSDIP